MADTSALSSNSLFEILEDWNEQLKHIDFNELDDEPIDIAEPSFIIEEPQP